MTRRRPLKPHASGQEDHGTARPYYVSVERPKEHDISFITLLAEVTTLRDP